MALVTDPGVPFVFLRMAELQLKLGYRQKALTTVNDLQKFASLFRSQVADWAFARVRLHAESFELGKVQRLVDGLIDEGNASIAAPYAARLIEHLERDGKSGEAQAYSDRICALAPGDTLATLEGVLLCLKHGDRGGALDRWELALRNGANLAVAKASLAAIVADHNESDHWRMLGEVMPVYRQTADETIEIAYRRTAESCGMSQLHRSAVSLFNGRAVGADRKWALAAAVSDRTGTPIGRAVAAAAMVHLLSEGERGSEYLAAIRTTLTLFTENLAGSDVNWEGLLGFVPRIDDMSFELGRVLLDAGDAAGAVEVLKRGYSAAKGHTGLTLALADALARTNQHGSALTILDELAMTHRKAGRLEEMAATLRQMSQLAPTNIKVKTRLIDAYLQRGFVAEARAELVQRADLEQRAGKTPDAIVSLQRAADLSWTLGFPQESFNLYDRILALDSEDVGNRSALVNLYLQVGRLSEAAEHQRVVVDIALRNGRKHEAIAALHQVIGLTPDDMTAYYQLGEALSTMGEYHQAEKVYRRIVLMNPDDAVAQAKATAMTALKEQASGR
jgi:tetratricopeptide (TPR) repeat protein